MFCCTLLYVHPSIANILMGKRELVALLNLSSWCLVMVEWLFLAVSWGCLRFMIVVFPDHADLLFYKYIIRAILYNMEQSFSRIVSDFNETFCICLFSPKTKSFMLNSLIFTSVSMVTESKVFAKKSPKITENRHKLHSCNF